MGKGFIIPTGWSLEVWLECSQLWKNDNFINVPPASGRGGQPRRQPQNARRQWWWREPQKVMKHSF